MGPWSLFVMDTGPLLYPTGEASPGSTRDRPMFRLDSGRAETRFAIASGNGNSGLQMQNSQSPSTDVRTHLRVKQVRIMRVLVLQTFSCMV